MNRTIYIRQGFDLPYPPNFDFPNCPGDKVNPCIEINVIFQNPDLCFKCNNRIECLVNPAICLSKTVWHICSGPFNGIYHTLKTNGPSFFKRNETTPYQTGNPEEHFMRLTGLTFEDVVYRLYRI